MIGENRFLRSDPSGHPSKALWRHVYLGHAPHEQTDEPEVSDRYAEALLRTDDAVNRLTFASFDPHSRQPSCKHCAVKLTPG